MATGNGARHCACGVRLTGEADVLDTTRALASDPVVRQLCTVGQQLRQYRQSPTVASFLDHLGEELRNRRQAIPAATP